jgi:hypothetical protein
VVSTVGDLHYGSTVTRNVLGFQGLGNEFSTLLGHIRQMVVLVHICIVEIIVQQQYTCLELSASILSFYTFCFI